MIAAVALLLVVQTSSHAPVISSDDAVTTARNLFDSGRRAYDDGRYPVAIVLFENAERLSPRPVLTYALAQAYRLQFYVDRDLGKLRRAVTLYRAYLAATGEGSVREQAAEHLAVIEPELARSGGAVEQAPPVRALGAGEPAVASSTRAPDTLLIVTSGTPAARVRLQDAPDGLAPAVLAVKPGRYAVAVDAPLHVPRTVEVQALEGRAVSLHVDLLPQLAHLEVRSSEDGEVTLDGTPLGPLPLDVTLEQGTHVVRVARRGHDPVVRPVTLRPGGYARLDVELEPSTQRKVALGLMGGAGLLLVGAGVSGALAVSAEDDALAIERQVPLLPSDVDEHRRAVAARDQGAAVTGVLLGTAAVSLIVGSLLYWLDGP